MGEFSHKKIITFAGPKGVGKTTIARTIESRIWQDACIFSFADPIRKMLSALVPGVDLKDPKIKEEPIPGLNNQSPRQLMQSLGTEWGRNMVADNVWTEALRRDIETAPFDVILIDDCRFANEIRVIREMGGVIVGITRKGINYTNEHATEQKLVGVDYYVNAEDIEAAADEIMADEQIEY